MLNEEEEEEEEEEAGLPHLDEAPARPLFAFHTASFMTDAIALYDRLGFRRAPEFDFDITALAYLRQLAPTRAACA